MNDELFWIDSFDPHNESKNKNNLTFNMIFTGLIIKLLITVHIYSTTFTKSSETEFDE
jgi:hypothetical protein